MKSTSSIIPKCFYGAKLVWHRMNAITLHCIAHQYDTIVTKLNLNRTTQLVTSCVLRIIHHSTCRTCCVHLCLQAS